MSVSSRVTCIITGFERPDSLIRLCKSIREYYPALKIVIADDSSHEAREDVMNKVACINNATYICGIPFDIGLSAKRNLLAGYVDTEFTLLLDDDFEFTEMSKIQQLMDILDSDSKLGVVGGVVLEESGNATWGHTIYKSRNEITLVPSRSQKIITKAGSPYHYSDTCINGALFRTEVLLKHKWRNELKLAEHLDFYWRLKQAGEWLVGICPNFRMIHHRDRDANYSKFRSRGILYRRLSNSLNGIDEVAHCPWFGTAIDAYCKQNVILLTPGHTGSSVVSAMMGKLGWNLGQADKYGECVKFRELNQQLISGKTPELDKYLNQLNNPFCIKDPRFSLVSKKWMSSLQKYEPILLHLTRDENKIRESAVKRNENPDYLSDKYNKCYEIANEWPWPVITLDFDDITGAINLFKSEKIGKGTQGY